MALDQIVACKSKQGLLNPDLEMRMEKGI